MMKKTILCLMMALCLCLCMILASCKPEEVVDTPPEEVTGQFHTTPDSTAGVGVETDNPVIGNDTARY